MAETHAHSKMEAITRFWLVLMSLVLATSYLLPNHYFPWSCFHAEALAALALSIPAVWMAVRSPGRTEWYWSSAFIGLALGVLVFQYLVGVIHFWGTFWVCAAYLLGLLLALQLGSNWERMAPGQCLEYLSIAFVVAALASFPIELSQWLGLFWDTPLLMQVPDIQRPFANMAQPNLLADLYLLAVVGASWLYSRQRIAGWLAWVFIGIFLLGAALTGSRAAWINTLVLLWFYSYLRPSNVGPRNHWVAVAMAILFFVVAFAAPKLQSWLLQLDLNSARNFSSQSANSRLIVWNMMFHASVQRPWLGYGWGQVNQVNFVFEDALGVEKGLFSQSHNLFLDLVLWNGYPLGLLFIVAIVAGLVKLFRLRRSRENAHVQVVAAILFLHSMIEFPVYYTYFLFPLGMLIGTVRSQIAHRPLGHLHRGVALLMVLVGVLMLVVTTRDYFQIERSFYALRFESRGYLTDVSRAPPDTWVLSQLQQHLWLSRSEVNLQATAAQLSYMEDIVRITPGAYIMFKLALNYGLVHQDDKAGFWLKQICYKSYVAQCAEAKNKWQMAAGTYAAQHLMPWPLP